jgi:PLP dependent protein
VDIQAAVVQVLSAIRAAAARAGRNPDSITLVAVSKTRSIEEMHSYAAAARREGVRIVFGENYVQEIKEKRLKLPESSELHVIGPLQGNKVRDAVLLGDVIESVHSLKVVGLVAKEAARVGKRQRILLQVNVGQDENKSGFSVETLHEALEACTLQSRHIQLEGLMTILPYQQNPEASRPYFKAMAALRAHLVSSGKATMFHDSRIALSMGMSDDFSIAIEEGADVVRVGTAIFGERS